MRTHRTILAALTAATLAGTTASAMSPDEGTPPWQSAGPIAFGPSGLLLLADTKGAAVLAVELGDTQADTTAKAPRVEALNEKVAALLGTTPDKIAIADLAVNPASGRTYLSVARGKGPDARPALIRVEADGALALVTMDKVIYTTAELRDPIAGNARGEVITDLAYVDGRVIVAGLSNEQFSSRLLVLPYPFTQSSEGASVEIFHGAHGRLETKSPVRTFVPCTLDGESYILAAYTCTPLVRIPVAQLKGGGHFKGTTIAELGNRNKPLDLVAYSKDGRDYLLMANSSRGVMKIAIAGAAKAEPITARVAGTQGVGYETIASLKGVTQLDKLDATHAVILVQEDGGALNLQTIDLP